MIREDVCVLQIFVCLVVSVKKHNKSFPHRHGNLAQGQLVQAWPISRTIATQRFCKDAASCAYPAVQHTHGFAEHAALQVHDVLSLGRSYSYHSPGLVAFGVF